MSEPLLSEELRIWIGREVHYEAKEELSRASIRYLALAISDPPYPNYNGGPTQWGEDQPDRSNLVPDDRIRSGCDGRYFLRSQCCHFVNDDL
jgi:hypothetical protein